MGSPGSQMMEHLLNLAKEVRGVAKSLEHDEGERERLRAKLDDLADRLSTLEGRLASDKEWSGQERRKVDERLGTGDHTFGLLRHEIANVETTANGAYEIAKQALDAAEAARDRNAAEAEQETSRLTRWGRFKRKARAKIEESLVAMAFGVVFWALYHLLLVGPEIAKLMKRVGNP